MKKVIMCYLSLEVLGLTCDYFFENIIPLYHIWLTYIIEFMVALIICHIVLQPFEKIKLSKTKYEVIPSILVFSICLSMLGSKFIHLLALKIPKNVQHLPSTQFFILSVFIAPLAEEFFFRHFLLGYLLKINHQKKYLIVVMFTAFLFGLTHWTSGYGIMTFAFILGIGYGLIYAYTNDIKLCILCHFCNNLIVFLASLLPNRTSNVSNSSFISSMFIFLIMFFICIRLLSSLRSNYRENEISK